MVNVERISISFSKFLLKEIDDVVKKKGYSSRSELIRDAVRKHILESNSLLDKEGNISGIIIVVYTPTKESMEKMSKLYFEYNDIVKSLNQSYITTSCGKNKKVEIFVVEGNAKRISEFYDGISKIDGKIYDKVIVF
ncbi:CopG family ribbon-helix-helix protein [Methanocaldococcus sp. 28A]